jgi:hypothetical protein
MNARAAFLVISVLWMGGACAQNAAVAQNRGLLRLPEFAGLAEKANESVNVTFGPELLGLAARFLGTDDPESAAAKKLVSSLTGVYVRNYTFDKDFAYPKADVDAVRRQLSAPGWTRMVETRSRKENTDVDVYMLIENGRAQGLAVIASEPREFTIVNIVGSIDLEQLHDLQKLGVPDLELETVKKPPAAKPATAPAPAPTPKK